MFKEIDNASLDFGHYGHRRFSLNYQGYHNSFQINITDSHGKKKGNFSFFVLINLST